MADETSSAEIELLVGLRLQVGHSVFLLGSGSETIRLR